MNKNKPCTDWDKCCFCEKEKQEKLTRPNFTREDTGYKTLHANFPILQNLWALPITINPSRYDNGTGIENTLKEIDAKYLSFQLLFAFQQNTRGQG